MNAAVMRDLAFVALLLMMMGCGTKPATEPRRARVSDATPITSTRASEEVISVEKPCLLMCYPDSTEIELMRESLEEEDLATVVEDNEFYSSELLRVADSLALKHYDSDKMKITLVASNRDTVRIRKKEDELHWAAFLLLPGKSPEEIDLVGGVEDLKRAVAHYRAKS